MISTIFLGPSLPLHEARAILPDANYRPPAAQGDLIGAVSQDGADLIGLIDGTFHQTLSVWHSEVCYLLSRGVGIFGSSSMGALRAVETERYGAVGVGTIFRWYRDGFVVGDDEVALVHGSEETGYRPLSLALVNIRASLEHAVAQGWLAAAHADQVIALVRSIYYPERQPWVILRRCEETGLPADALAAVERALNTDHIDLKRTDAIELLTKMRAVLDGSTPRPPRVDFAFSRSSVFETLYSLDRRVEVDGTQVSLQSIREHAALHRAEYDQVQRAALDRSIVSYFGSLLGLRVPPEELESQRTAFMEQRGLDSQDALQEWLHENGMSETDLSEYLTEEALCARLRQWIMFCRGMDRGCRTVLDEARVQDLFCDWAKDAAEEEMIVAAYREEPEYEYVRQEDPPYLAAVHNSSSRVRIRGDARRWAEDAGFDDIEDLIEALRRSAVYYDVKSRIARQMRALERAEAMLGAGAGDDQHIRVPSRVDRRND